MTLLPGLSALFRKCHPQAPGGLGIRLAAVASLPLAPPVTALQVALPLPLPRAFDYLPPAGRVPAPDWIGRRVRVPFGHGSQVGLVVGLLYGAQLVLLLPTDERISWQGHLFGFAGGVLAAILFRRKRPKPQPSPLNTQLG